MRHLFIAIYEKLTSWFCVIIIPCFMFSSFFYKYYYLKHTIVIVVMLWGAIIAIGGMMSYLFPYIKTPKQPLKEKGMPDIIFELRNNNTANLLLVFCNIYNLQFRV